MSQEFKSEPTIIPVALPEEGTFTYVAVKGSLHATDCCIFGLNKDEVQALMKRYEVPKDIIRISGLFMKGSCIDVINSLGELGYRVVSSTGEAEITWTLQREV